MARFITLFAVALVLVNIVDLSQGAIGGDLASTLKIGQAMCAQNTPDKIEKFFACYDHAPGKDKFVACQMRTYGSDLSTTDGVSVVCQNRGKVMMYAGCLRQSFAAAGIDLAEAVGQLNKCQAYVLGVE